MKKTFFFLVFINCIQLFFSYVIGQDFYNFERISVEQGLMSGGANIVFRDYMGYVWIGTNEGLHKYDGEKMYVYRFGSGGERHIIGKLIYFIYEESESQLIVSTDEGLVIYERNKDKFVLHSNTKLIRPIFSNTVLSDCRVFAYMGGIHLYYGNDRGIEQIDFTKDLPKEEFFQVAALDDNNIALIFRTGVWNYDRIKKEFKCLSNLSINGTIATVVDNNGVLWVANTNSGIHLINKEGESFEYSGVQNVIDSEMHFVQDIEKRGNEVWISTDGEGIFIFNLITKELQQVKHIQGDPNSLPTNSILDLFVDAYNNVLAGSVRYGMININRVFIRSYSERASDYWPGLSASTVHALYEDEHDNIWIGTEEGGLNVFDPDNGTFEQIPDKLNQKIVSMCSYRRSHLLISYYRGPIRIFNIEKRQFESNKHIKWLNSISDESSLSPIIIKRDNKGKIWIFGTTTKFVDRNGVVEKIDKGGGWHGEFPTQMSDMIELNEDEVLLVGFQGVYRINIKTKTSTWVVNLAEVHSQIATDFRYIYSIEKGNGVIWLTSSMGLFSYNEQTNELKAHNTDLFNEAYSIVPYDSTSIWVSSGNGLYRYFTKNENFRLYGRSDGVLFYNYTERASLKCKNGDIYLGAVDGLVKIKQASITEYEEVDNKVSFDQLLSDGIPVGIDGKSRLEGHVLKLPWNNTSLILNLVVSEKELFRKRLFQYNIEGYSDETIETSNSQLTLSHLPAGKYTLKAYCNNSDGSWNRQPAKLSIYVPNPWWKQWWFFMCLIGLMGVLYLLIRKYQIKQSELVIELKLERERKDQIKALNEQKLEFFTNISHELRTPLSLIYAPLRRLISDKTYMDDKKGRQIQLMYRKARKMKRLIDQVLDIRKMEVGKDEINLSTVSLQEWIIDILNQYELEFQSKKINLIKNIDLELTTEIDIDKLDKTLSNLLSNAIKYSPVGGHIYFDLKLENDKILFSVGDEGPGIDEKEKSMLFERFYQAKSHKAGSGVGLAYVLSLVKLMEGDIWVNNRTQGGALFEFYIPLKLANHNIRRDIFLESNSDIVLQANEDSDFPLLANKTILVVENDNDLREFIVDGLSSFCKVIEASNGKEGWHLVLSQSPDLIISDVMMPIMNGFELCQKIKQDVMVSHLPVFLLTARSDGESRFLGYKVGADAYLSKPFSLDILCVRMVNIFINREAQRKLFISGANHLPQSVTYSNPDELILKKVISIINDNMDDPDFDVDKLNSEFAMSRSVFYSKIKTITGQGVNDFIKQLKINKAADLLCQTTLTIGEIADNIGFKNQRYFSTVFKELKGCTPTKFRQLQK